MVTFTNSSARTSIEVADPAAVAAMASPDPNVVSNVELQQMLGASAIVLDGLRRRPRYFDGRFLTGADLTRDQDYIRQRQADLARACGTGVVLGLQVSLGSDVTGQSLTIEAGHGVTPAGELVAVTTGRTVALLDLATSRRLDASLGLRLEPRAPLGRRTGLFILALRPVEFTANPIAAYPTTVNGPRQIEDGDIIEATAITLIPYADSAGAANLADARRAVARDIFLGEATGLPQDALPLAMVGLERGGIRWIDMAMVRRETGADTPLQVSMGARPRALAEAFVLQHLQHLRDVLQDRADGGLPPAFAAAQYFAALPAAGQLPAAAVLIDDLGFRQLWFPPSVDVEISFAPSDEIAAIVEESLTLPPIDLAPASGAGAAGVVVLAPVSRPMLQRFEQALGQLSATVTTDLAQGFRRPTAEVLAGMLARRALVSPPLVPDPAAVARAQATDAQTRAWQAAWNEAVAALSTADGLPPRLWYVRRRAVAYEPKVTGIAVPVTGDDANVEAALTHRLADLGLADRLKRVTDAATPFAAARIAAFLSAPKLMASPLLFTAAVRQLEQIIPPPPPAGGTTAAPPAQPPLAPPSPPVMMPIAPTTAGALSALRPALMAGRMERVGLSRLAASRVLTLSTTGAQPTQITEGDVIDVASDFADPRLGEGLDRLLQAQGAPTLIQDQVNWLADANDVLDLDATARSLDAARMAAFAPAVAAAIAAKDEAELKKLIAGEV